MIDHQKTVHEQFDPRAQAYLQSPVHAQGPDLLYAQDLVAQAMPPSGVALDVGCGAGHLSFALAHNLSSVTALDSSPSMLSTVDRVAAERGLSKIHTVLGDAAALPFEDGTFCVAATRYSAHHWATPMAAVREMRRVVKPGGYLLVIDVMGEDDWLVDTHLQTLELLRDRSHVRDYSVAQWRTMMRDAAFTEIGYREWPIRLHYESWIQRMSTPANKAAMIRELQTSAPREVRKRLAFESDGSFTVRTGLLWARAKPA